MAIPVIPLDHDVTAMKPMKRMTMTVMIEPIAKRPQKRQLTIHIRCQRESGIWLNQDSHEAEIFPQQASCCNKQGMYCCNKNNATCTTGRRIVFNPTTFWQIVF